MPFVNWQQGGQMEERVFEFNNLSQLRRKNTHPSPTCPLPNGCSAVPGETSAWACPPLAGPWQSAHLRWALHSLHQHAVTPFHGQSARGVRGRPMGRHWPTDPELCRETVSDTREAAPTGERHHQEQPHPCVQWRFLFHRTESKGSAGAAAQNKSCE